MFPLNLKRIHKTTGLPDGRLYNNDYFLKNRVIKMKRSRTEVGRWRMLRQAQRRRARWLENHSRRSMRIHSIRKSQVNRRRNALLFAVQDY